MKYNTTEFNKAVKYYKKKLDKISFENLYVYGLFNEDAFLSIAPLSRAVHELGKDMNVVFKDKKEENVLFDVWETYDDLIKNVVNDKTNALQEFLKIVDKKTKSRFSYYLKRPELILTPETDGFEGSISLDYSKDWFAPYKWEKLEKTAKLIIKNVLALKKKERVGISFVLVKQDSFSDNPLEDVLDSYQIALSVIKNVLYKYKLLTIFSQTNRESMLEFPERVSELSAALLGCELSKNIDEPVFKAYKKLSGLLNLKRIKPNNAIFGIRGKGYPGRHIFGESIGYPTPNKKSRWNSPAGMMYKFSWYPQSHEDFRKPKSRIGFTSTVPIDIFINSVLIDYHEMRKRNKQIIDIMQASDKIIVKSNIENGCDFEVGLVKKDGTKREVKGSDSDARFLEAPIYKKQGKSFGMMANIPGGEAFTTPEYLKGKIVGDVVIQLDNSYRLFYEEPLVINAKKNSYEILSGPRKIVDKLREKKQESWQKIIEQEENKSVPEKIINLKKKNFNNIGEFAVNTNPKAKLCNYLIVNEKIANMIHIALGSGFEPDKATEYHIDIVIDSPRQKLDIYGIDISKDESSPGKQRWIIKDGKFVV
ncbi:hypothetical protein GF327_06320 [Candidatus Woesearchaeota archaeon]|nr:hypothetical protein [Candidatus Woesearchaeota archaeon]